MNAVSQAHWVLGAKTQNLAERASMTMPGRQSNLRAQPEPPVFIERAQGQRLWDVDGRELIDFAIGMGPGIWGHGNREYQDALHAQLEKLFVVASGMLQTEAEVELAEKIVSHVPCADRVRFVTTGSEAVQMVVRLARAFTGRRLFVRFEGHYHGTLRTRCTLRAARSSLCANRSRFPGATSMRWRPFSKRMPRTSHWY